MSANEFGQFFKIMSFGESHGEALGVVIDGCPAGVNFDQSTLDDFLLRRRPGLSTAVSARAERDMANVLSGVFENKTLGTPIAIIVKNEDARSADYEVLKNSPRVGHADDMWANKFLHSDWRGGGRSSGRETVARVLAGALAKMFLQDVSSEVKPQIFSHLKQVGPLEQTADMVDFYGPWGLTQLRSQEIVEFLNQAKIEGQSYGGIAQVVIKNPPQYLGQPVFHKLKSDLASAMMSVGATTGFELGGGFSAAFAKGTEFHQKNDSEVYGGVRGGISTGEDIVFRVAFKPTSTVLDTAKKGRHDPCIVLRALPVLEAMAWLVLADHYLWSLLDRK